MIKILELFAGIGACSTALDRLGIEHEIVEAVEIDKYAMASFNAIHGTNFEPQDICTWNKDIECDLIMHGSPCQDISVAGQQAGADENSGTRSSLMYETIRIVEKLKPKYVIWENVKNLLSKKHRHNFDNYLERMENMGYRNYYQVLNAKDYGIPQNRERVFTISIRTDIEKEFRFPEKEELKLRLKDMLEEQVDEKYYLSDKGIKYVEKRDGGYTQIATEQTEIAHCPITAKGNDNWTGNFIKQTRLGGIYDTETKRHQAGSIWDKEGLAPTIETMQGGNRQPIIIANTETSFQDSKVVVKTKNKRILKLAKRLPQDKGTYFMDIYNQKILKDETATLKAGMDWQQGNIVSNEFRIRKLTPKECFRLMRLQR